MFAKAPVRDSGRLPVSGGHEIYWEESGSPNGVPALHLHGGPGAGLGTGGYRTKFDPDRFRLIGIDQRGCGRSTPLATAPGYDLSTNTTPDLIDDIEAARTHLGVEGWLVSGVSWGATLAVAYAQAHARRVLGVVLMAVTTTDRTYVEWITETIGAVFPEAWDRLATHAEESGTGYRRGNGARLVEAYAELMTHPDPAVRDAASRAWCDWEVHHVSLGTHGPRPDPVFEDMQRRLVYATLVTHYWAHDGFLDPPLLARMEQVRGVPATLIHGRLDVSGPTWGAWQLHRAWPGSRLHVQEDEGHGGPEMVRAWCAATSRHLDLL